MPSFGLFVLSAILAVSVGMYTVGNGTAMLNRFSTLQGSYESVQRLMIVSLYLRSYLGSQGFMDSLNLSMRIDGMQTVVGNSSVMVVDRASGQYLAVRDTNANDQNS